MRYPDEIIIEKSRGMAILILLGALGFVAAGFYMYQIPADEYSDFEIYGGLLNMHDVALFAIVFFLLCFLAGIKVLRSKAPGLRLTKDGFFDNSSAIPAGLVLWSDVRELHQAEMKNQTMITVLLKDPGKYIRRGNILRQTINAANNFLSGSPVNIMMVGLKTSNDELMEIFTDYFNAYQTTRIAQAVNPEIKAGETPVQTRSLSAEEHQQQQEATRQETSSQTNQGYRAPFH
ncbi:hypothetical protein O4H49_04095 [Kiloniella laminariae]|uniref:Uncharacterized protein n=1 Tax=Kiloniella laminariae TaxID=454162 RepID=A0ABT4LHV9_9PROT|nr:STM3941 family protein [Kiloniella laminariae]MCZ4279946.1 hypothetical protein [Kiloniella laminariae]